MLRVESFAVGPLQANCHLVWNEDSGEALIVDPGGEGQEILRRVSARNLTVAEIWLTHAHIDHIGAFSEVQRETGAPGALHAAEKGWLTDAGLNLADWVGVPYEPGEVERLWEEGEELEALGARWRVLHTPGHSPGSVVLLCEEQGIALSGDLIMQGSIGRMDLPGGSEAQMRESLGRVMGLADETRLFVGHGGNTTVGAERETNPLVREFVPPGILRARE